MPTARSEGEKTETEKEYGITCQGLFRKRFEKTVNNKFHISYYF